MSRFCDVTKCELPHKTGNSCFVCAYCWRELLSLNRPKSGKIAHVGRVSCLTSFYISRFLAQSTDAGDHPLKSIAWSIARNSGMLGLWRKRHRAAIPILTAHGVWSDDRPGSWTPLWNRHRVEQLETALRVLREHYDFISLDDAIDILEGRQAPREYAMVLTFDDGYLNNYSLALPVLESLNIPASFFVCPGMMENGRRFWIDRLDFAIQHLPAGARSVDVAGQTIDLNATSREQLADAYQALRRRLKSSFHEDFDERVDALADELESRAGCALNTSQPDDDVWAGIMNWSQTEDARQRNTHIGSHTTDHVRLTLVDTEEIKRQLTDSKARIGDRLGSDCVSIAYPNGDHSAAVRQQTREAGYRCGLTCDAGINQIGDDLFALKRINFPSDTSPDKILGIASGFRAAVASAGL